MFKVKRQKTKPSWYPCPCGVAYSTMLVQRMIILEHVDVAFRVSLRSNINQILEKIKIVKMRGLVKVMPILKCDWQH